jgi:hypothetical protein
MDRNSGRHSAPWEALIGESTSTDQLARGGILRVTEKSVGSVILIVIAHRAQHRATARLCD